MSAVILAGEHTFVHSDTILTIAAQIPHMRPPGLTLMRALAVIFGLLGIVFAVLPT
jgi:hypothetical protein